MSVPDEAPSTGANIGMYLSGMVQESFKSLTGLQAETQERVHAIDSEIESLIVQLQDMIAQKNEATNNLATPIQEHAQNIMRQLEVLAGLGFDTTALTQQMQQVELQSEGSPRVKRSAE
ncbi:hypothetical protein KIPB_008942 [Kipferlia bialata]|uniref:Uncharacterized protein n=1 Tax=Kipferlia bialata TaxID=797122 RepID=A0A9K3D2G7_9EUKA|nr:hypothetical protein KIPB_008942 [Kipferlia bialata]|eukprot:g8942.t1